jgi:hypothetical protein
MIIIYIISGVFLGIMIPTIVISATPKLAIKLLEGVRIYKKGSLSSDISDYTTGAGYYRKGRIFIFRDESGSSRFENGRVFGFLVLIFTPSMIFISVLLYLFLSN